MSGGSIERLSAGVAEDDRIARAAIEGDADSHSEWHVFGCHDAMGVQSGGELKDIWKDGQPERIGGITVVYDEGNPTDEQAEHIARHDPKSELRRVEAIRKVIAEYRRYDGRQTSETGDVGYDEYVCGYSHACERIVEALASIYTDEATETEGTQT